MVKKTNLKHLKLKPEILDMVRAYLALLEKEGNKIKKAIIFGSYAKNKADRQSDLDICLVSSAFGQDGIEEMKYLLAKARWTNPFIEAHPYSPQDFKTLPDPLLFEIKKHGIEIPLG